MIYLSHENKTKGIERFEEILNQDYNKYDIKKIPQIDHNTEETIKNNGNGIMGWSFNFPIIKLSPMRAIDMIRKKWIGPYNDK